MLWLLLTEFPKHRSRQKACPCQPKKRCCWSLQRLPSFPLPQYSPGGFSEVPQGESRRLNLVRCRRRRGADVRFPAGPTSWSWKTAFCSKSSSEGTSWRTTTETFSGLLLWTDRWEYRRTPDWRSASTSQKGVTKCSRQRPWQSFAEIFPAWTRRGWCRIRAGPSRWRRRRWCSPAGCLFDDDDGSLRNVDLEVWNVMLMLLIYFWWGRNSSSLGQILLQASQISLMC